MTFQRLWALIVGWALTAIGLIGLLVGTAVPLVSIGPVFSVVYLVTGLVALFFAYYRSGVHSKVFDQVVGFIYVALAIAGFAVAGAATGVILDVLAVSLLVNVLNLIVGIVSLIAGYAIVEEIAEEIEERRKAA